MNWLSKLTSVIRSVVTSPFWIVSMAVLVAWTILAVYTEAKQLVEVVRLISLPIFTAVVFAFAGPALHESLQRRLTGQSYLILGISVSWFAIWLQTILVVVWRMAGQPAWLLNNDLTSFLAILVLFGATMHIAAPGAVDGTIPRRNKVILGVVVGTSLGMLVAVMLYSPTITQYVTRQVNKLRPYLDEGDGRSDYSFPRGSLRLTPPSVSAPTVRKIDT